MRNSVINWLRSPQQHLNLQDFILSTASDGKLDSFSIIAPLADMTIREEQEQISVTAILPDLHCAPLAGMIFTDDPIETKEIQILRKYSGLPFVQKKISGKIVAVLSFPDVFEKLVFLFLNHEALGLKLSGDLKELENLVTHIGATKFEVINISIPITDNLAYFFKLER